jgi:hypothetical protein
VLEIAVRDASDDFMVLTWLHRADRDALEVHPCGQITRSVTGVDQAIRYFSNAA